MRRIVALVLVAAVTLTGGRAALGAQAETGGTIRGTAQSSTGQVLSNYNVQLRNLQTGELVDSTTSDAAGSFSFGGLSTARYVIEIVSQAGAIVGTSSAITVTAAATVTVSVTAPATAAIAATGAIAGVSTATTIAAVAAAAGIAGVAVAVTQEEASPSR
jgi:hypothetical protein